MSVLVAFVDTYDSQLITGNVNYVGIFFMSLSTFIAVYRKFTLKFASDLVRCGSETNPKHFFTPHKAHTFKRHPHLTPASQPGKIWLLMRNLGTALSPIPKTLLPSTGSGASARPARSSRVPHGSTTACPLMLTRIVRHRGEAVVLATPSSASCRAALTTGKDQVPTEGWKVPKTQTTCGASL